MFNSSEDLSFIGFIGDNSLQNRSILVDLPPISPSVLDPLSTNDSDGDFQYDFERFEPIPIDLPPIFPRARDPLPSNDSDGDFQFDFERFESIPNFLRLLHPLSSNVSYGDFLYNFKWFKPIPRPIFPRLTNRKKGRQNGKDESQHTKLKNDCRMAKIQPSYFNCLIASLNTIMRKFNIKYFFINLAGKYKSNINQQFRADLIKKTIKQILKEAPISEKYTNYDKNHNINVIDKLIEERQDIILNILDKNFLYFFERIYFSNKRKFNLSTFGLCDCEVELPKSIHLFQDLVNKNKKNKNFIVYEQKLEECAKKEFIKKSIRLLNNTK